jgi:hypothetical protein
MLTTTLFVRLSVGGLFALWIKCGAAVIFQIMVVCQNHSQFLPTYNQNNVLSLLDYSQHNNNTGQQNLILFLSHEEKYVILIEFLTLNSNM